MKNRAGRVLAVAVGVLVLLAVVAGIVSATRPGPQLPEGSPEAAVRDYIASLVEGDHEAAAEHLDPQGPCTVEDLELNTDPTTDRVVLRTTETDGDEARVRVDVVHGGGGPFDDGWRDEQAYELRREGDRWVIAGEPWPVYYCEGRDSTP